MQLTFLYRSKLICLHYSPASRQSIGALWWIFEWHPSIQSIVMSVAGQHRIYGSSQDSRYAATYTLSIRQHSWRPATRDKLVVCPLKRMAPWKSEDLIFGLWVGNNSTLKPIMLKYLDREAEEWFGYLFWFHINGLSDNIHLFWLSTLWCPTIGIRCLGGINHVATT